MNKTVNLYEPSYVKSIITLGLNGFKIELHSENGYVSTTRVFYDMLLNVSPLKIHTQNDYNVSFDFICYTMDRPNDRASSHTIRFEEYNNAKEIYDFLKEKLAFNSARKDQLLGIN